MQGSQQHNSHASLKDESVWFKAKLVSQFLTLSFLVSQPFYLPYLHAAPAGGEVVGGTGSISQSDLTTTINQSSQNLAIDWQSFDVNTDEIVNFVQPNSSSLALNRILGNNGSTIQGQINANGQVILVNPNGIFFTSTATINVGGLVASSLDMVPSDFMNGNYIFNEVLAADGAIINSGIINASVGGNVALIGKQVKNDGLISANLGSVVLAAGKQSVLTFDNQGLIGVQITKEVLQEELGLEEAVINSGEINAAGGRVLLTASVSQDIFTQAVNNGSLNQATSVVVHDDGSFTLGGGADVLNTGSIDVSSESNSQNTARIILLGENITSSGSIKADTQNGNAGEIEIHANNKTLLTENSITSAQTFSSGQGGLIKVLGNKVGLFDAAQVNASGANGGGEVLIGGDRQGLNTSIRNADFIYLGADTVVKADATDSGNGGKIITFAKDTARIHGNLFARGGLISGDGGFIETSGLIGFEISNAPDVSATNGNGGLWLIDPYDITIVDTGTTDKIAESPTRTFTSDAEGAILEVSTLKSGLNNGNVTIVTGGDASNGTDSGNIKFDATLDYDETLNQRSRILTLKAHNNITFTNNAVVYDSDTTNNTTANGQLNIFLEADRDKNNTGDIFLSSKLYDAAAPAPFGLNTNGGDFEIVNAVNIKHYTDAGNDYSGVIDTAGGKFKVAQGWNYDNSNAVSFDNSLFSIDTGSGDVGLDGINSTVKLGNITTVDLDITKATDITQSTATGNISTVIATGTADLDVTSGSGTTLITLENSANNFTSVKLKGGIVKIVDVNGIDIDDTTITDTLEITSSGNITDIGDISVTKSVGPGTAIFNATGTNKDIILDGTNNNFERVNIKNAGTVTLIDSAGGISFSANDGLNNGGINNSLTLTAVGGDITSYGEINAGSSNIDFLKFKVDSGRSIELSNDINNTFGGQVEFSAATGKINNIDIIDNTVLRLKTIDITGNLTATATTLTQDSTEIVVAGDTTLSSSGNITLTDTSNDFNKLTISAGEVVSIQDNNAISLLSSATNNNLTITAGGNISLVGDISTNNNTSANAGDVNFIGDVRLAPIPSTFPGNTITINTNATGSLVDGVVTFTGDINNDQTTTTPRNNLEIISGNGNVDFQGDIGTTANIGSLVINDGLTSTATVNLGKVRTRTYVQDSTDSIDITAGTINLSDDIATNRVSNHGRGVRLNGDVTISGNNINISTNGSDFNSDGNITITGTVVNLDATNRSLTIDSDTGAVDFQQAVGGTTATTALKSLNINSGASVGNTVNLAAVRTEGGTDVINVKGTTITLDGDLIANQGDIILDGDVVIGSVDANNYDIAITSCNSGSCSQGDVTVTGTINGHNSTNSNTLTITSNTKKVSLQDVGDTNNKIQQLTINTTSGDISVGAISTRDNTSGGNQNDSGVKLTSASATGVINLGGDIITNAIGTGASAGDVEIDGNAILKQNLVTIDTNYSIANATDGNVVFNGTVNGGDNSNRSLTIAADSGSVTFNAAIGNTINRELKSLTVTSASTTTLQNVNTGDGGIDVISGIINLAGTLDTKADTNSGIISLDGNVNLNATSTTVELNTDGSGNDADITISGTVNNTKDLILNAGSNDVSMKAAAGSTTTLQSLTVTGDNVYLGDVTSIDFISVSANTTNTTGIIDLAGNLTTTGVGSNSSITLKKADVASANVVLTNDVILQVNSSSTNNITIEGNVNADNNTNDRTLTINSGTGIVDLQGDIGNLAALNMIKITNTGTTNLQNIRTRLGGIDVATSLLNLSGDLITTDEATAGGIRLAAQKIDLYASVVLDTDSTSSDGIINITRPTGALGIFGRTNNSLTLSSGMASTTISQAVSDVSQFTLQSSGSTILNGVNSNGTITANASNGLTLNGAYLANTITDELMSFNADSDANGVGTLLLGNGSSFVNMSGPISFTGAALGSNDLFTIRTGASGSHAVEFNATNDMSLGASTIGFSLNNTKLSNISASSIELSAANDIYFSNVSQSTAPGYILYAVNNINNSGGISVFSSLDASADNMITIGANITTEQNLRLTAPTLNVINFSKYLTSNDGNINLSGNITGSNGYLYLNADNVADTGTVQFDAGTNVSGLGYLSVNSDLINLGSSNITTNFGVNLNVRSSGGVYNYNSIINAVNGSTYINAGNNDIFMASGSSITSRYTNYLRSTDGDITLSSLTSASGSTYVLAVNGRIIDNNGTNPNITSSGYISLEAVGGIGSIVDPIDIVSNGANTQLVANNSGSGSINISNNGDISLYSIVNTASDSSFNFTGLGGDVTIRNITLDQNLSSTSAVASFNLTNGSVYGDTTSTLHIAANSASFDLNGLGEIGDEANRQPLIVDIGYKLTDINTTNTYIQYYLNRKPQIYDGANQFKNKALQAIENISGQQLIEVEALADVDAAIFTDVRNYSHSDVALMMPSDQRYTEEDEEDEEAKEKREKLINSTP